MRRRVRRRLVEHLRSRHLHRKHRRRGDRQRRRLQGRTRNLCASGNDARQRARWRRPRRRSRIVLRIITGARTRRGRGAPLSTLLVPRSFEVRPVGWELLTEAGVLDPEHLHPRGRGLGAEDGLEKLGVDRVENEIVKAVARLEGREMLPQRGQGGARRTRQRSATACVRRLPSLVGWDIAPSVPAARTAGRKTEPKRTHETYIATRPGEERKSARVARTDRGTRMSDETVTIPDKLPHYPRNPGGLDPPQADRAARKRQESGHVRGHVRAMQPGSVANRRPDARTRRPHRAPRWLPTDGTYIRTARRAETCQAVRRVTPVR